jgi:hypothetical protein
MKLPDLVERVQEIRSKGPGRFAKERLAENAQELSRAGTMQLRVELMNEAIAALVVVLYEADGDGRPANIDRVTWRLLVPAPWGRGGWKRWGLRRWEAEALRNILRVRTEMRRHVNLFDYNEEARTWHINRGDYPTLESAIAYLKVNQITLAEWRKQADVIAEATRIRMQRYRMR